MPYWVLINVDNCRDKSRKNTNRIADVVADYCNCSS